MTMPIITTHNLTRRFDSLTAVDALNLEVARGEIFGLVGPDGAGKTTTLRLLCGLLEPTSGSAQVVGYDASRQSEQIKDHIGYMAQSFGLYVDLTVEENMRFYADLYGLALDELAPLMTSLLEMTRMTPFRRRLAGHLSGGMKQKLALMCALLHRPEVLLLDEPTTGVDPVSRRDFWQLLYQVVRDGMTVIITTAYLDEAERCSRVGLMDKGRLIRCDTPNALQDQLEEDCYEIHCSNPRVARTLLAGSPGVSSVEFSGYTLHLFLSPSGTSPEELKAMLEQAGCAPARVTPIRPSMDDVFIALVGRPAQEAA